MPMVTIEEAQARLPELIHDLLPGEELVIIENSQPIAMLTRSPLT
jgi:antitoxin (DNA-binding transcriptional repressor) of toxin-antitoxin stability system